MARRGAPARRPVRCKFMLRALLLLLLLAITNVPAAAATSLVPDNPIGVHSMLYLTHPFSAKQAMFEEAAAVGASTIRLDIELSGVFPNPGGPPDWTGR
jgi:ABC-type sugar transport system substrate-binding protein